MTRQEFIENRFPGTFSQDFWESFSEGCCCNMCLLNHVFRRVLCDLSFSSINSIAEFMTTDLLELKHRPWAEFRHQYSESFDLYCVYRALWGIEECEDW